MSVGLAGGHHASTIPRARLQPSYNKAIPVLGINKVFIDT